MRTWLTATALVIVVGILMGLAAVSCGGGKKGLPLPEANWQDDAAPGPGVDAGLDLVMLRDASGAPSGVKLYWWRVNVPNVEGYYIYRDTQHITEADPDLRVNGGNLVPQPPEDETAIVFSDAFPARVGVTYYYRVSAVDIDGDESPLSWERSITIENFYIEGFSPIQARVGQTVTITGRHFSEYNEATDAVFFTGVKNNKGPSALQVSQVQATVLTWDDSRIRVSVPIGATVGRITVQSNDTQQQTSGDFQCLSPYILSFDPDPVNAGSNLDFYGANFGTPDATNLLLVDDSAYGGVFREWADDHVRATVPTDITTGLHKFELLIDGEVTNHCWIDVISTTIPQIDKVTPNYVVRDSGSEIAVIGSGFGESASSVDVVINGVTVTSADFTSFSNTEIRFNLPAGVTLVGEAYVILHSSIDVYSNSYIYHTIPGGQESLPEGVAAGFDMGKYSDAAYDYSSSTPYVIYTDNTEHNQAGVLFLATWDSDLEEWVSETLTTANWGDVRWPRLAVDSTGKVHYAYQLFTWMTEVRYGVWDPTSGVISDERVYQASSQDTPGDYLDMYLYDDGLGNVDVVLAWSMNQAYVQCGYKLSGDSSWTVNTVYTADGAYGEVVGFYCSLDITTLPIGAPPPHGPSSLGEARGTSAIGGGSFIAGVVFGLYSADYTPNYEVRLCYSFDLDTWSMDTEVVDTSSDPITETVLRWQPGTAIPNILWCTDNEVRWARNEDGYARGTVTDGDGPYGAALELLVDPSGNAAALGHNGEYEFFVASASAPEYTWSLEFFDNPDYREPRHAGRGSATFVLDSEGGLLGAMFSLYDGDMRDIAVVVAANDLSSWEAIWTDVADGFATPGYLLSNQAVVIGEDGRPCVVFSDVDPQSGVRSLWFGRFVGETPVGGFSHLPRCQWEYFKLDSVFSGTLGRATMSLDANGDYHIAYQRNSQIVYLYGNPAEGFGSPNVLETFSAIPTAGPQIALGTDSTQDVFIATQRPDGESQVVLLSSDDNMATHTLDVIFANSATISQYDLAVRYDNGGAVIAAYLEGQVNAAFVYDVSMGSSLGFAETAGMNRGLTLTLDDDQHYCVTVADVTDTEGGFLLEWDTDTGDYALNMFTDAAAESMTMSQCRVEYGPVMTYVDGGYDTGGDYYWKDLYVSLLDDAGRSEAWVSSYSDDASISVYHSVDAYEPWLNVYAWHPTIPSMSCLFVSTYASYE